VLTGAKMDSKLYRWHTGFPGGLKEVKARHMVERDNKPDELIRSAVWVAVISKILLIVTGNAPKEQSPSRSDEKIKNISR